MPNNNQTRHNTPKHATRKKYRITEELAKFTRDIQTQKRKEICEKAAITRQTLSAYENLAQGEKLEMNLATATTIAYILGCKIENLTA